MAPPLPEEVILEILRYTQVQDLWLSIRPANKQFKACAEDVVKSDILPHFKIRHEFLLDNGTHRRGYEFQGSVTLTFTSMSKYNPKYALFSNISLWPPAWCSRSWEKWNQICSAAVGNGLEWRVRFGNGPLRTVSLPSLMISNDHGVWCDWREMLDAYCRKPYLPDGNRTWAWQTT